LLQGVVLYTLEWPSEGFLQCFMLARPEHPGTSCVHGDTICPVPLLTLWRPSTLCATEQMQSSSTLPRRIRYHTDCCSRLMR